MMTPEEVRTEALAAVAELNKAGELIASAQLRLAKCRHSQTSSLQKLRHRLNLTIRSVKT